MTLTAGDAATPGSAGVDGGAPGGGGPPKPWKPAVTHSLKLFVATRLGLGILALIAVAVVPFNKGAGVPGWPAPVAHAGWSNLFTAWERWDALWFLRIAAHGYRNADGSAAFFPMYPLLVRGVSFLLGHHPLAAGLIVSNGCFLAALVVFYRLTEQEYSAEFARRSTIYLAIFPTAFFFLAPYSESLFLLLAVSCFLLARQRRWIAAGIAGALASATRSTGLVLVPALGLEAYLQLRDGGVAAGPVAGALADRLRQALRPAIGVVTASLGILGYLAYWSLRTGGALTPFSAEGGWERRATMPWAAFYDGVRLAIRFLGTPNDGYQVIDVVLVTAVLAAAAWAIVKSHPSYGAYVLFSVLLPLTLVFPGRPLMSLPRFALTIFPVFWGIAALDARIKNRELLVAASAAGLGLLTVLFVAWYFIF
ncbi:MAG TPA: mannosyltransferase family protein [Actinomycetota bacterium]|nr:mannosyltransferase family protein [Actinomycetota bacterium]